MIKNYNQYVKEQLSNLEVDPYGEEEWEDENYPPLLQIVRLQKPITPFDQVTIFSCSFSQLTSLEGVEKLVNLQKFDCGNNQLTSLKGIENLVNLQKLYCSNNQLTSLEGVEKLVNLEWLYCRNNRLTSLGEIENLVNLHGLVCSGNQFNKKYKKYLKTIPGVVI